MSTFNERLLENLQQPSYRRKLNRWMEQVDDVFIVYTKPQDNIGSISWHQENDQRGEVK